MIRRTVFMSMSLLPISGCSTSATHLGRTLLHTGADSQPAGGLVDAALSTGSLWPVTFASGLFLLAAIPAFFILSRRKFITLLVVGILLAISPVILLRVLDHLVIPFAILIGLTGAAALAFFLGRLWDRRLIRKRAKAEAEKLVSSDTPAQIKDWDAAGIVTRITEK